jgi:hypothetical protein
MGNQAPVISLGKERVDPPLGVASLGPRLPLLEDIEVQLLPSVVDLLPGEKLSRPSFEFL